jgi:outer membrane lipoprotein-sorting protein
MKFVRQILFLVLIGISSCVLSQPPNYTLLTGTAKTNMAKKITMASQKVSSLQCRFIQKKTSTLLKEESVSKGLLFYKTPNSLRWEYTEPTAFVLVFHNETVSVKDEKGMVSNPNKMLKQLGNFIVSTINGDGLIENGSFKADYYANDKDKTHVWIRLTPVAKRLKEMYSSIQIKVSTTDYLASELIMEETTGDKTTITFVDKKINTDISSNQFMLH